MGGPCWSVGQQPPLLFRGHWPAPQITAAPLELVGTSTWSCCYRGWEPTGGLGPARLAPPLGQRSGEYSMTTHLGPLGPHGPRPVVFLWRLLITQAHARVSCQHCFSGRSPVSTPDLLIKPGVAPIYSSWAAFARSDTRTPSLPKFLVSSFLSQPDLGPSFRFGHCGLHSLPFAHPSCCSRRAEEQ